MMSKEELEKLTVAQIKEKLKSRKLPVSGAKSDLVNRLYESIMTEENLLEDGPGGESIDLSGVNMDEVLGLDDEKETNSAADTSLEEVEEKKKFESEEDGKTVKAAVDTNGKVHKEGANETQTSAAEDNKQKNKPGTDENAKMLKNAERLGLPLKRAADSSNSDEKLKKREMRFGAVGSAEIDSNKKESKPVTEEDAKMLKRAERFGLPLKRAADSSDSTSSTTAEPIDDTLKKRAMRFGIGTAGGAAEVDTKKESRAKRFGLTS